LAWACNPSYRGNGYTSEAVSAVIKELNLQHATARIESDNIASQMVAEKVGFVRSPIRQFNNNKIIYEYIY
jgi:RimJ/RimL family protein N-acetyltransferase